MEIENGIFVVVFGIRDRYWQCVAFSIFVLSKWRRYVLCVWNSGRELCNYLRWSFSLHPGSKAHPRLSHTAVCTDLFSTFIRWMKQWPLFLCFQLITSSVYAFHSFGLICSCHFIQFNLMRILIGQLKQLIVLWVEFNWIKAIILHLPLTICAEV